MNDEGVWRTAPATPGLLKREGLLQNKEPLKTTPCIEHTTEVNQTNQQWRILTQTTKVQCDQISIFCSITFYLIFNLPETCQCNSPKN